jgi:hypothetical protein
MVMNFKSGFLSIVTVALGLITLTGMAYTDRFPQAAYAESVGFDALAHQVFSGVQDTAQQCQVAEK